MSETCKVCGRKDGVSRCTGCRVVFYCGKEHQSADRPGHKAACEEVKQARDDFERQDRVMRDQGDPADENENADDENENAGDARPYIISRFLLADTLLKNFGTVEPREEAVRMALNHLVDLLSFNRLDPLYLRHLIPSLYVVLRMDQHAYDFVKWWATSYAKDPEADWNDLNVPYLDTRDADILEPLADEWTPSEERRLDPSHPVIVMILKIRALLDLMALRSVRRSLHGVLPPEIICIVQEQLVGCVTSRPEILRLESGQIWDHMQTLWRQILQLYKDIHAHNLLIWPAMFAAFNDPAKAVDKRPIGHAKDPDGEARYVAGYTIAAWRENPGVVRVMYDVFAVVCCSVF